MSDETASRPPGRPRSARADRAILDAALDLFIELGYDGMSMEAVATRAGVGKATVYRRWPNKEDLVVAAIGDAVPEVREPDSGELRQDLLDLLGQVQQILTSKQLRGVFPHIAPHVASGTSLGEAYISGVLRPRFRILEDVIVRGMDRGELHRDTSPVFVRELITGPLLIGTLLPSTSDPASRNRLERIVDTTLRGLAPRS